MRRRADRYDRLDGLAIGFSGPTIRKVLGVSVVTVLASAVVMNVVGSGMLLDDAALLGGAGVRKPSLVSRASVIAAAALIALAPPIVRVVAATVAGVLATTFVLLTVVVSGNVVSAGMGLATVASCLGIGLVGLSGLSSLWSRMRARRSLPVWASLCSHG